jgi:hypothetical protein
MRGHSTAGRTAPDDPVISAKAGTHNSVFHPTPFLDVRLRGHDDVSLADEVFNQLADTGHWMTPSRALGGRDLVLVSQVCSKTLRATHRGAARWTYGPRPCLARSSAEKSPRLAARGLKPTPTRKSECRRRSLACAQRVFGQTCGLNLKSPIRMWVRVAVFMALVENIT